MVLLQTEIDGSCQTEVSVPVNTELRFPSSFFKKKSSIIKPTILIANEQLAIRGAVANPVACIVSMPSKY